MTDYVAQPQGGTVIAGTGNDTVTGSANADVIYGRGGNDFIQGGAGNDVIYGDGTVTYAQAFSLGGSALSSFTGTVSGSTGLLLTSMGVASNQSIWRVRNGSDADKVVVLQSASQGNGNNGGVSIVVTLPAHSEIIIPSANLGTHKLFFSNKQVDVKASSGSSFDLSGLVAGTPDGDDVINGGDGDDTIYGNGGNDIIYGSNGNDTIDAGTGNDMVSGGAGFDTILGGDGDDNLTGDEDDDVILGQSGADKIFGSSGHDKLNGGSGNDYSEGGDGDDVIDGDTGNDELHGGAGNDVMTGNFGTDKMFGEDGNDTFLAEWDEGNGDYYNGGDGIDTYKIGGTVVENYALIIDLIAGTSQYHDTFIGIENLIGGTNNDVFRGDNIANGMWGGKGDDLMEGRGGDDTLYGEDGNDTLDGGDGNDIVDGGAGDDVVRGGAGADTLSGGDGNNSLDGGDGDDTLTAGAGDDKLIGGAGADTLLAGNGNNSLDGGDGDDNLKAGAGNDTLIGGAGADTLSGGEGVNILDGGDGDDTFIVGTGADKMIGGAGFDSVDYSTSGAGVIIDMMTGAASGGFADGDMLISIENIVGTSFADVITGDAEANRLVGGAGDDVLMGGAGADILIGGDGLDLADYFTSRAGVYIDLNTGEARGGDAEGDVLSGIENLRGSAFDDVLIGSAETTLLDGAGGNDVLDYSKSNAGITVNLLTNFAAGGYAEGDIISDFENLIGSSSADQLNGTATGNVIDGRDGDDRVEAGDGADMVMGGAGKDALLGEKGNDHIDGGVGDDGIAGGLGADELIGGAGRDTIKYSKSVTAVTVNLTTGLGEGGEAQGDIISGVESIVGSTFDDILTGDAGGNRLNGARGADKLYGMGGNDTFLTGSGYDYVDGGAGSDTVSYEDSWDGVKINLATGINQNGSASRDVLVSIESVIGSNHADQMTGNDALNKLTGGAGNDVVHAGAGGDYIYEGRGNDMLFGEAGNDVFVFSGVFDNDTIADFTAGIGRTDRIWLRGLEIKNMADVLSNATDTAAGAHIELAGHGSITLQGVKVAQLVSDDFLFG